MRAKHTLKRHSVCEVNNKYPIQNDENDMRLNNILTKIQKNQPQSSQKEEAKDRNHISKIRKEYLEKLKDIEHQHTQQIYRLKEEFKGVKDKLEEHYKCQLNQKDEYILLLQEITRKGDADSTLKSKKCADESKYVYTEGGRHPIIPFEQISERIDFKIGPNQQHKQMALSKTYGIRDKMQVHGFSANQHVRPTSISKHKLIPKGKPEEIRQARIQYKHSDNKLQHYINYKLMR